MATRCFPNINPLAWTVRRVGEKILCRLGAGGGGSTTGFTLMELILVMVLIALSGSIVIPQLTAFLHGLDLEIEARKLAAKIREAQQAAIAERKDYRVYFNTIDEKVRIEKKEATWSFVEEITLKNQIGIQSTTFLYSAVYFDQLGVPRQRDDPPSEYNGGDIILDNLNNSSGPTMTLKVTTATGRVEF